ncbi:hypothetical protein FEM48_Zijuj07G0111300 [Ziziphus jujuba var. spinosa]|uniref:Uncharacterized protein n=1 Tax=Ziziphus jujuba var. spinosa TaxID=714518 RepID=A0A978V499_ZIZJJ|nr:hypothetical protein FEM48_Zijuj07G0111300 [Ziziphus jujuba var. spinosa]
MHHHGGESNGNNGKVNLTHILAAASLFGFAAAGATAATHYYRRRPKSKPFTDPTIIPRLDRTESGRVGQLEKFTHYVGKRKKKKKKFSAIQSRFLGDRQIFGVETRQLGFLDANECPKLCKVAYDYLRKSEGCEGNIYELFANQENADSLYEKLIDELDKCILTYFAFHWSQASLMISQVLNVESENRPKLRDFVLKATR